MPVTVKKLRGKFRVVEAKTGRVAKNNKGTSVDGGGYSSEAHAKRQARAINASLHRRGKI